jgi:uncharacterized membrane protein
MVILGFLTVNKGFKIVRYMPNWRSGLVEKLMNTGIQIMTVLMWYGSMILMILKISYTYLDVKYLHRSP